VTEEFLLDHEQLAAFMARALLQSALAVPGAVDNDVRDALGPMIRTYRTLQSGLIYETRPANPYAAAIQQALQARLQDFRERVAQSTGLHSVRDADILGILVFLERMELQHNNGRRRGRAFLDFLRGEFPDIAQPAPPLVSG